MNAFRILLSALVIGGSSPSMGPGAECHSSGGKISCGFHCIAGLGEVHCSQTSEGLCTTIDARVVCWDPPPEVSCHPREGDQPECKSKPGRIACGYHCTTSETDVRCANTPYGICTTFRDHVICWDPTAELINATAGDLRRPECKDSVIETACGYHCKESFGHVQCAQSPSGRCGVDEDHLYCWDPPLPPTPPTPCAPKT